MQSVACPLCGSTSTSVITQIPDLFLKLPGLFTLVRCSECSLIYQNPRLEPHEIGAYYPPEYDPYIAPPWSHPSLLKRIQHLSGLKQRWRIIEQWAPRRNGTRSLLDIGCATGSFLATGSAEWRTVGVEFSTEAAQIAREQFGLKVYQGTVEQAPLEPGQFDVVSMWDVLEHVHDPTATLRCAHRLLRPDGILVARVPNLDAWDARIFGDSWAGLDQPRHMFITSETTLARLLYATGFEPLDYACIRIGTYGMLMLSWRFWLQQHVATERWRTVLYRLLDNLPARIISVPMLWLMSDVFTKAPLITAIARPAQGAQTRI
jgi:2-polyprenyl-3-methyl-5-hydroxy-6-metoxy-1,4-benzoquinol methylase